MLSTPHPKPARSSHAPPSQALEGGSVGEATSVDGTLRVQLPDAGSSVLQVLLRFLYLDQFEPHLLASTKLSITAAVRAALPPPAGGTVPSALDEEELLTLRTIDGTLRPLLPARPLPLQSRSTPLRTPSLPLPDPYPDPSPRELPPLHLTGLVELLQLINLFHRPPDERPPALSRLVQLCERGVAQRITTRTVVPIVHAVAQLRAPQLERYCFRMLCVHFDELQRAGALSALPTPLTARLFLLRSAAPLQDALTHGRVDALVFLLTPEGEAALVALAAAAPAELPDGAPTDGGALLRALDARGRTALEMALAVDDVSSATLLLGRGATADTMAAGGDDTLLHAVCAHELPLPRAADVADGADLRLAELLLSHGATLNAPNGRGETPLDICLFRGSAALARMLLGQGAISTLATAEGGCLLHAAAAASRHDVLEAALPVLAQVQINLNQADALGRTPLHTAVREADERIVAQLLAAGASTEARDDDGSTPLQCAVQRGSLPIVGALLAKGADTNVLSADGVPVLVLAAEHSPPIAFALLEARANPNLADGVGRTALEVAVAHGAIELCEALLATGAQPTKRKDSLGNTSLHTAVALGSEPLVRLLLSKKAEIEQQNRKGCTPLLLASEAGQTGVVQQLLGASAGLHLCDSSNRSALELALEHNHLETLATLLHQACVDINGITKRGSSLLHLAAELGDEERVTFLLRQHAQVDVLNPNGETPLHWACSLGHLNAVRCLVQAGASAMLHERVQGMTPLHAACGGRSQPAVLALLIQRCEYMQWNGNPQRANLLDAAKNTPLHTSTKLSPQPLKNFPILLEHGANPNLQNVQGQAVLHLLAERAVRQQQLASTQLADGAQPGAGAPPPELPMARMLDMLSEACTLQLDAQEAESGNTALHIAAFGGCIEMAQQLVCLGASVGLPNRDGFTALDSMQPTGTGRSLQSLLLAKVAKPPSWTPDRLVNNCQQCKLPFNRADPNMARKHHCRHCGRCVCSLCSARRLPIPKFGSTQDERVCLLCERVLTTASAAQMP